jgi:hypothetical protein
MKINPLISKLCRAAKTGSFISFDYDKGDSNGPVRRTIRPGINVAAKFERENNPLKNVGNWATEIKRKGKNNCIILRGKDTCVQATDLKDSSFKYFKLSKMSNIK